MKNIEVFVDSDCNACVAVVRMIRAYANNAGIMLTLYHRKSDPHEFQKRNVAITPVTFIDLKLAFYGEFSLQELQKQLTKQT